MMLKFKDFLLKEEASDDLISKVKLSNAGESQKFQSLPVNSESNPNLSKLIEAFNESAEVEVGYSTLEKTGGENKPTLKKKNLYLCGGSLRDHLLAETFKSYDLVTDATPSEIKMILKASELNFTQIQSEDDLIESSKKNYFYTNQNDSEGKEMQIVALIAGQKFFINTLNKHSKYKTNVPKSRQFTPSLMEDAKGRNFTCNALYLQLKNEDGENAELLDPLGGLHDLRDGIVKLVDSTPKFLVKEPENAFLLCDLSSRLTTSKKVSKVNAEILTRARPDLSPKPSYTVLFKKAINNAAVPTLEYLANLKTFQLDTLLFPGLEISNAEMPLPNNDIAVAAYLLKKNNMVKIAKVLSSMGWDHQDCINIIYLIKLSHWAENGEKDHIKTLIDIPINLNLPTVFKFLKPFNKADEFSDLLKKFNADV